MYSMVIMYDKRNVNNYGNYLSAKYSLYDNYGKIFETDLKEEFKINLTLRGLKLGKPLGEKGMIKDFKKFLDRQRKYPVIVGRAFYCRKIK